MKSFPTELNPWYVVFRFMGLGMLGQIEYLALDEGGLETWTENPKKCRIFLTLRSAIRTAMAMKGEILVLHKQAQLPEYGRDIT